LLLAAADTADRLNLDISLGTWAILGGIILVMMAFDLFVYARGHIPSVRENAFWSIGWIAIALAFGVGLLVWQGSDAGSQYFAGYLLERSLSLDNIFVFAVILSFFAVPGEKVQGKVLAWGIMLALGLRLIFIMIGAALLDQFHITFYFFGLLLLYTAWKLARHDDTEVEPENNPALKVLRKRVTITDDYHGEKLFTKENGKRVATPLLAVFVVIATTDIIFAVDSIPAIFAVTQEPFIVFAANAFALIGLRALYFLLVGLMDRFVYLTQGLSFILAFIGIKMLLIDIWHVPIWLSLAVIAGTLAATAVLSLRAEPKGHGPAQPDATDAPEPDPSEPKTPTPA
jgi:tellurite resistance protein TerC